MSIAIPAETPADAEKQFDVELIVDRTDELIAALRAVDRAEEQLLLARLSLDRARAAFDEAVTP